MRADDGGEIFFAAEGSAGLGLDDLALVLGEGEDVLEGVDEVVGALHGALDLDLYDLAVFDDGLADDSVVLDVELLLGSGAVLAFYDVVGLCPDLGGDGCGPFA